MYEVQKRLSVNSCWMVIFFAKVVIIFDIYKKSRDFSPLLIFLFWRRERDSNPRSLSAQRFSRPPQSTTLPSLQRAQNTRFLKSAAKVLQKMHIRKFFEEKMYFWTKKVCICCVWVILCGSLDEGFLVSKNSLLKSFISDWKIEWFCKVEVTKSRKWEFLIKKCRKMPLFCRIIWSIQKKVVPLHAFSRRVNVRMCA